MSEKTPENRPVTLAEAAENYRKQVEGLDVAQRRVLFEVLDGVKRGERRPLRVIACAGAGKTKTMVVTAAALSRAQEDTGLQITGEEVVMTTFTNTAAAEMRNRLATMLPLGKVAGVEYQDERGDKRTTRGGVLVATYHSLSISRVGRLSARIPFLQRAHGWKNVFNIDLSPKDRGAQAPRQEGNQGEEDPRIQATREVTSDSLWRAIVEGNEKETIPGFPEGRPSLKEIRRRAVEDRERALADLSGARTGEARTLAQAALDKAELTLTQIGSEITAEWVSSRVELYRAHGASTPEEVGTKTKLDPAGRAVTYAWNLYNKAKYNLGVWDYADAIQAYHDVCEQGLDSIRFLVVDEAQDNNPVQMRIARYATRNHPKGRVVYVGDPRQSIYGFRGAEPEILTNADKPVQQGGENAITLELATNYRSTPQVVEAGNRLVRGQPWAVGAPAVAFRPSGLRIEVLTGDSAVIMDDIAGKIADGAQPKDFAILARKRISLNELEAAALARNIPIKTQGGGFFSSKAVAAIMRAIRIARAPAMEGQPGVVAEAVVNKDLYGLFRDFVPGSYVSKVRFEEAIQEARAYGNGTLDLIYEDLTDFLSGEINRRRPKLLWAVNRSDYFKKHGESGGAKEMQRRFRGMLKAIQAGKNEDPPGKVVDAVARIMHEYGVIKVPDYDKVETVSELPETDENEASAQPDAAAVEAVSSNDRAQATSLITVADTLGSVEALVRISLTAQAKLTTGDMRVSAEDKEKAEEREKNAVIGSTIHGAKGLEYATVFLLVDKTDVLPDMPGVDADEELRIMYVGVTRARDRLVLCHRGRPSDYVDMIRPPKTEIESPTAPETPETPTYVPVEVVEEVTQSTLAERDYLALREVIASTRPDLLAMYDAVEFRSQILRLMAEIRREREAAAPVASLPVVLDPDADIATGDPTMPDGPEQDTEPPDEAPEPEAEPEVEPEPEAPVVARRVQTTLPGDCYVQVRVPGDRSRGGPVSAAVKGGSVTLPEGTPLICHEPGGRFSFGYASEAGPSGWVMVQTWDNSQQALAEVTPLLHTWTAKLLKSAPAEIRIAIESGNAEAADLEDLALWAMTGAGGEIRKEGGRYTARGNLLPGGTETRIARLERLGGLVRSTPSKNVTAWTWAWDSGF